MRLGVGFCAWEEHSGTGTQINEKIFYGSRQSCTIWWDMMDQHTKHSEYIFWVQLERWSPSPRLLLVIYSTSVWLALGTGAPFQVTITFSEIPRAKSHTQARSKFPLTLISSIWVSPCCRPSAKRRKVSISAGMAKHTSRPLPIVIEGLQLDRYNASRNTHGNDTAFPSNLGGIQIYPSQKSATGASYPDHIKTNWARWGIEPRTGNQPKVTWLKHSALTTTL